MGALVEHRKSSVVAGEGYCGMQVKMLIAVESGDSFPMLSIFPTKKKAKSSGGRDALFLNGYSTCA